LYSSVSAVVVVGGLLPPKTKPAVCVPAAAKAAFDDPKLPPDVQLVPPYSSVAFVCVPA